MTESGVIDLVESLSEQLRTKGYTHVANSLDRKILDCKHEDTDYSTRRLLTDTVEIIYTMSQSVLKIGVQMRFISGFFKNNFDIDSSAIEVQSEGRREFNFETLQSQLAEFSSIKEDTSNIISEAKRYNLINNSEKLGSVD